MGLITCGIGLPKQNTEGVSSRLQRDTPPVSAENSEKDYTPLITDGLVSLPDRMSSAPVRILRDTGEPYFFVSWCDTTF